ncbi:hypothetical protein F4806DRAFT_469895 [Annulohypoxylon nitens]|nr:hypothetical protein F4806DRAFT_469895 [Annulohypoxylon nitens]
MTVICEEIFYFENNVQHGETGIYMCNIIMEAEAKHEENLTIAELVHTGPGPIYLMARDCRSLFVQLEERLENENHVEEYGAVLDYHDRFEAWAAFLGVFGGNVSSLDYRLRRHSSIQDLVMRLLDVLRDEILIDYHDSPYPTSMRASEQARNTQSQNRPHNSTLVPQSPSINETLVRLNRLGLWIRSLSRPDTKRRRARAVAESQNLDLRKFQYISSLCLENMYPNCPESLREQLARSMTDRYTLLWYESYRIGALTTSVTSLETSIVDNPESLLSTEENLPTLEEKSPGEIKSGKHVTFDDPPPASTLISDPQRKLPQLGPQAKSQSHPTQTESTLYPSLAEPPVPKFEDGKDFAKCEWCFAMLDNTMFRKRHGRVGWSHKGRKHYRHDLQPYNCISEGCFESFNSQDDWMEHMEMEHSEYWPQKVHNEPVWICPLQHAFKTLYMFATRVELDNHMHLYHQGSESATLLIPLPRPANACLFCSFTISSQSDDAFSAATSQDQADSDEVDEFGNYPNSRRYSERRHSTIAIAQHIASHMEAITLLTLRLVSITPGYSDQEGDSRSAFSTISNLNASDFARHREESMQSSGMEADGTVPIHLGTPVASLTGTTNWDDITTAHREAVDAEDTKVIDEMHHWEEDNTFHNRHGILDWVKTEDYRTKQREISSKRQPGTGQWLLETTQFKE